MGLLSEEAAPGLRRHFKRFNEAGGKVDYRAFQSCYKEFQVEFENPATVDISAHFSEHEIFVRSVKYRMFLVRTKLGGQAAEMTFVVCVVVALSVLVGWCTPRKRKAD